MGFLLAGHGGGGKSGSTAILGHFCLLQGVFNHIWNHPGQQRTGCLQTWICIDFNEPWLQSIIYHEVIAENLEALEPAMRVHFLKGAFDRISCHFLRHKFLTRI